MNHPDIANKAENEIASLKHQLNEQSKSLEQFTYIVSHDLQAPLRMVTGFLDLLERRYAGELDEQAKEYIDFAVRGAARMKALLADLLVYSRLSSPLTGGCRHCISSLVMEARQRLEPGGLEVHLKEEATICGDREQLVRVFQELFDNAIKYRSELPPQVRIDVSTENNQQLICVADNGMGVDPAFMEKIFLLFRRLQKENETATGTGAGLAICRRILELHGGTICATENESGGTKFWIRLPLESN